ncbi:MAG TPA: HAMP domain-containing sensor histidine kinase [Actinomycetospora sp.]|jgi:two-component system OmpR family sensor kinase|uniref:sensor histidine kinase n=1 Tax=Actinomycetospora sp. TaxID=1872135 RepID=UPI002F3E946F
MIAILALLTAAIGSAAAVMGPLAGRLGADSRPAWLGVAAGGGVVVVLVEGGLAARAQSPVLSVIALLIPGLVASFLLAALTVVGPVSGRRVAAAVFAVVLVTTATGALGTAFPVPVAALSEATSFRLSLSSLWAGLALAVVVTALDRHERATALVGAGVALLGVVHLAELLLPGLARHVNALTSTGRLLAVALVLVGTLRLIWRALLRIDTQRDTREEELRLAAMRLERTAERDHELRTGLAGLEGATRLLGSGREPGSGDTTPLDALLAAEIRRLEGLLRAPVETSHERPATSYDVEPVLQGLVTLRRVSGMDVRLEVDAGLRAVGSPEALAQVMTNVFANAQRHAPRSPVRVTAMRWNDRVVIRVRDFGRAIAPTLGDRVFETGVREVRAHGSGLGLHVCRRLLAAEHGSIVVRSHPQEESGCTVVVDLPGHRAAAPALAAEVAPCPMP